MAKRKRKDPMATTTKSPRVGRSVTVWLPDALFRALEAYIDGQRPRTNKTAIIEDTLEKFLTEAGAYPPDEPAD